MTRRVSLLFTTLALALALPALPWPAAAATGDPVLSYGVDIVSNYVWRGGEAFSDANPDQSAFKFVPAVQPSLTFYGPGGLSFGLWGSYALTEREPADFNLKSLDELDYTLAYEWSNRMGSFSAGLVSYTITDVASQSAANEMFVTWGLPLAESLAPTISHYVNVDAAGGSTYTSLGISGGESLTWNASLGVGPGIQDLTAGIGYGLGESISVSLNMAYRPDETVHGYAEGADFPAAIAWLTFSYGRDVVE